MNAADPRALTHSSSGEVVKRLGGGKGSNLHRLTSLGLPTPRWAIVPIGTCSLDLVERSAAADLRALLDTATEANALELSQQARRLIVEGELAEPAAAAIDAAYALAGGELVAVRSSGAEEDGEQLSFAGQFDTFLNVRGAADVRRRVRECWASAFSERALIYRLRNGLALSPDSLAVVVQEMVAADKSGVAFTANPVTGDLGEIMISSVYGLGEGLVSGAVDADTVLLDAASGAITETTVGEKLQRYDAGATDGGCAITEVAEGVRGELSLSPAEIEDVRLLAGRTAELFGAPQDIEWAFEDDRLWLLQARPITTLAAPAPAPQPEGEMRIWDNSNIIESFSGITSPLTFSTAADSYGRVYAAYARSLRVPRPQLRQMQEWLGVMLGHVHGRVYYNLLHWYRMVRIAPVYPVSRRVLEVSLGVEEPLDDALAESLHPYSFRSRLLGRLSRAVTVAEFTRRLFTLRRMTDRFMVDFYAAYDAYERVDYDALPGDEVYRRLRLLQQDLIERWGPMMVLDAALLLLMGGLYGLTMKWLPDAPEWFRHGVAAPGEDVESAEPARAMSQMAATVRGDDALRELITTTAPEETFDALRAAGRPEFVAAVESYIDKYGYRSLDELKLEVPDLREDPSSLFAMLRSALVEVQGAERANADEYLDAHLRGPKRALYEVLRRKTSSGMADRERLRFCRTRAFGMLKRMLRAIGRDLVREGVIDDFTDVFLLRLEELRGYYERTVPATELRALIALRKQERERDEQLVAPARFVTYGGPGQTDLMRAGWRTKGQGAEPGAGATELRGTPSSPGIVEGLAVVAEAPQDADGGILLTYRTDPGWVAALPSASALLIERGSPLTHVAIIARELGIPTVVGIKDLTTAIPTGARLRVDAGAGVITVLEPPQGDRQP